MKHIKSLIVLMSCLMLSYSCSEDNLEPINKDGNIPDVISNVQIENLAGKVKISYSVPSGVSLLYVEAECKMAENKVVKTKSSYYNNFIEIEGFGAAKEYEVSLYSVGRNLKRSAPTTIKVKPLTPPILDIFNSLEVERDFGGMSIGFKNQTEAEVSIVAEVQNENGEWVTVETFYTKQITGQLSVRGLEAKPQSFRIFVNDRWGNRSDILATELTPLFETELDKSLFQEKELANDPAPFGANRVPFLWNNNRTGSTSGSGGWYRTANGSGVPNHVAIDMGIRAKISRFVLWQRGSISEQNLLYTAGSPRLFELWGSNDPNPDGTYDSWIKLMDCELIKPSGQPIPTNTQEDIDQAALGHEFTVPLDAPEVRYVRIKVMRTFGVTDYFWMSELTFFGQPTN